MLLTHPFAISTFNISRDAYSITNIYCPTFPGAFGIIIGSISRRCMLLAACKWRILIPHTPWLVMRANKARVLVNGSIRYKTRYDVHSLQPTLYVASPCLNFFWYSYHAVVSLDKHKLLTTLMKSAIKVEMANPMPAIGQNFALKLVCACCKSVFQICSVNGLTSPLHDQPKFIEHYNMAAWNFGVCNC